ncbi:glycoside hydrolase family 35 protein [Pluteus cervinus]|uniref:Glycoside hydrolase family 35 protein n=1 Tax=Pluteus cervinus TaxID=181527 RepID=A0ACD3B807_9AGAR|nr:glycoside hydrolase family 35 protein [Pluteus cervinus]
MRFTLAGLLLSLHFLSTLAAYRPGRRTLKRPTLNLPAPRQDVKTSQEIVTWDEYSLKINGKRLYIFSGEVHPYRMPVQSLHLDIFQKIKSMGFNAISFYVFWGILESKKGEISFEGFRDLQPFFDAAMKAGIYLIARPGPYINAETSGGGFPGWGTYTPGLWRTSNSTYLEAYEGYIQAVGSQIAANQITRGGPVILVQAENEYSGFQEPYTEDFEYGRHLMETFRKAGVEVPITTNDAWPGGHLAGVDIYGYDSYPNGFDCSNPYTWKADAVPEYFWDAHLSVNPEDLNAVYEFQGGAFDGWGGSGYETCAVLTGPEFERVFYKNEFAMSTTLFNIYMIFGGTNWGGIAHPGVYTSYDYGSAIAEDRTLREKYYELKLQTNFLAVSPAFLTTRPTNIYATQGAYTGNTALKTTQVLDVVGNQTGFYVVRQADASSNAVQNYSLQVSTSIGNLTIPTIGGSLSLNGKDSKIHVVDYEAGSTTLVYSSAEIFTWATIDGRDVIIVYGDEGQLHETAFKLSSKDHGIKVVGGRGEIKQKSLAEDTIALQYTTTGQTVVEIGSKVLLYILDRTNAYQFWVLHPPARGAYGQFSTENPVIIKGGYLLRTVDTSKSTLAIVGDLNSTTTFEIIAPSTQAKSVTFNGAPLTVRKTSYGTSIATRKASLPAVRLPNLSSLTWKTADSLPEITSKFSDEQWIAANRTSTVNPTRLSTPVSLYAGDYGYHVGNILWRGHFTATGTETGFSVNVIGGAAFGYSVWLDSTFLGSWEGDAVHSNYQGAFNFPSQVAQGSSHVLTILQDHMGYEEDWTAASDFFKTPRGILGYSFVGSSQTKVDVWKVAGNLGGEDNADKTRGPLNEGGLFGERQGWHLPGFDDSRWAVGAPTTGISHPGVAFYRSSFELNIPKGVDYPLAIVTRNSTATPHFRSQIYVNGYQFGKYINHIGPQKSFPVPQGILNYAGRNTLAVSIWAMEEGGAKLESLGLELRAQIESSMPSVVNQPLTPWSPRNAH